MRTAMAASPPTSLTWSRCGNCLHHQGCDGRLTTDELAHKAHKLSAEELQLGEAEDKLDEVAFLTRKN